MDFDQENIKMEFAEGNVKTERDVYCVRCKKVEGGLFTLDPAFMMYCDDCFTDKKEECKSEWFAKKKQVLLPCLACLESYTEEKRLAFHLCNRDDVECCEHCGKQFPSRKSLARHYKIVHNIERSESADCGESFTNKFQLDKRKWSEKVVPTGNKYFQCSVCSKSFTQKGHLNTHLRSHTGEKPFRCLICSKSFSQKAHLKTHTFSHTGEKPFRCPTCGKSFTHKTNLDAHTRSHTGEKPFQCPTCCKCFTEKGNLYRHLRVHTGEKPFQCPTCSKSFTLKGQLKTHLRSHTGEKPYVCTICEKDYTNRTTMMRHIHSHIGFICKICGRHFTNTKSLKKHNNCFKK